MYFSIGVKKEFYGFDHLLALLTLILPGLIKMYTPEKASVQINPLDIILHISLCFSNWFSVEQN